MCKAVVIFAILFSIYLPAISAESQAEELILPGILKPEILQLTSGKSMVLKSSERFKRVSMAAPEIASYILLSPQEIYITGKTAGATSLILWENKHVSAIYEIHVEYDISRLKQKMHEMLSEEKGLRIFGTHDSITLAGNISSASKLAQAMALAKSYAPEGKINNLLQVGGVHQVMLEVRVAEMSRSLIKRLGVNFNYVRGGEFGIGTLGGLTQVVPPLDSEIGTGGPFGIAISPAVNAILRFESGSTTWTGFIDALRDDGLVKILAEPTLIALSGQTANFLVGGEFPVPVPQGLGTVAVEFKPFGVGLSFSPTVLSANRITMEVAPTVSELDFTTAVRLEGFLVPGLSTRRTSTVIELADGQSFAIAGLLRETIRDELSQYPVLGNIPILGSLFRSREFQKNETELVIIATPHLVKPLDMAKQTLPTDFYIEPNDMELYLLGLMEGREKDEPSEIKGELEGDFGHAVAKPK
jgi:pilus assembly protein CpaC